MARRQIAAPFQSSTAVLDGGKKSIDSEEEDYICFRNHEFQPLERIKDLQFDTYCGPTPESNWVIPGRLLVGAYPASDDDDETFELISSILKMGVRKFVCLQSEYQANAPVQAWRSGEALRPYYDDVQEIVAQKDVIQEFEGFNVVDSKDLSFDHCPIIDCGVTDDSKVLALAQKLVCDLARGEVIYLHCWGGHGRTGTVVCIMLYLMYGLNSRQIFEYCQAVHDLRQCPVDVGSPQTQPQRNQVVRVISFLAQQQAMKVKRQEELARREAQQRAKEQLQLQQQQQQQQQLLLKQQQQEQQQLLEDRASQGLATTTASTTATTTATTTTGKVNHHNASGTNASGIGGTNSSSNSKGNSKSNNSKSNNKGTTNTNMNLSIPARLSTGSAIDSPGDGTPPSKYIKKSASGVEGDGDDNNKNNNSSSSSSGSKEEEEEAATAAHGRGGATCSSSDSNSSNATTATTSKVDRVGTSAVGGAGLGMGAGLLVGLPSISTTTTTTTTTSAAGAKDASGATAGANSTGTGTGTGTGTAEGHHHPAGATVKAIKDIGSPRVKSYETTTAAAAAAAADNVCAGAGAGADGTAMDVAAESAQDETQAPSDKSQSKPAPKNSSVLTSSSYDAAAAPHTKKPHATATAANHSNHPKKSHNHSKDHNNNHNHSNKGGTHSAATLQAHPPRHEPPSGAKNQHFHSHGLSKKASSGQDKDGSVAQTTSNSSPIIDSDATGASSNNSETAAKAPTTTGRLTVKAGNGASTIANMTNDINNNNNNNNDSNRSDAPSSTAPVLVAAASAGSHGRGSSSRSSSSSGQKATIGTSGGTSTSTSNSATAGGDSDSSTSRPMSVVQESPFLPPPSSSSSSSTTFNESSAVDEMLRPVALAALRENSEASLHSHSPAMSESNSGGTTPKSKKGFVTKALSGMSKIFSSVSSKKSKDKSRNADDKSEYDKTTSMHSSGHGGARMVRSNSDDESIVSGASRSLASRKSINSHSSSKKQAQLEQLEGTIHQSNSTGTLGSSAKNNTLPMVQHQQQQQQQQQRGHPTGDGEALAGIALSNSNTNRHGANGKDDSTGNDTAAKNNTQMMMAAAGIELDGRAANAVRTPTPPPGSHPSTGRAPGHKISVTASSSGSNSNTPAAAAAGRNR